MTDGRTQAVIDAVMARYPGATISMVPRMDPDSIQIPDFLVVLDAEFSKLREVENYGLELTFAAFPGEPVPHNVLVLDPATAAEYLKGPPWLAPTTSG